VSRQQAHYRQCAFRGKSDLETRIGLNALTLFIQAVMKTKADAREQQSQQSPFCVERDE
jgi:hypothetical protein